MRHLLLSFLSLASAFAHAQSPSIEAVAQRDWTRMSVAAAIDPGCTGIEIPESIYLSRDDAKYRIYRVQQDKYGKDYYSKGSDLTGSDFQKLISTFSIFYAKALKDESFSEYLAKLPEDVREKKLDEHYRTHGQPIGGFGGMYIILSYEEVDGQGATIWEEFSDSKSFKEFLDWIRAIPIE